MTMNLFSSQLLNQSLVTQYLNSFEMRPDMGQLVVPRLIHYDNIDPGAAFIARENFGEEQAVDVVSEIRETWDRVKRVWPRIFTQGSGTIGSWGVRSLNPYHLMFEGAHGRLVEWNLEGGALQLTVGYATRSVGLREDRHARFRAVLPETDHKNHIQTSYDFGFCSRSLASLLRFLNIEGPVEHFEWYDRRHLKKVLQEKVGFNGGHPDRFDGDQYGALWKKDPRASDGSSGRLWADDDYSSLHVDFAEGFMPLLPAFVPLWEESVRSIRALQARAMPGPRRAHMPASVVSDAQPL